MKLPREAVFVGAAGVAVLGLLWWASRPGAAASLAAGAVGVVNDAAVGTVKGLGAVVGIPDTSASQCQRDINAGNWWDASFSCPAGTFIGSAYDNARGRGHNSTAVQAATVAQAAQTYPSDPLTNADGYSFIYF